VFGTGSVERAQQPSAHLLLHHAEGFGCHRTDRGEMDLPVLVDGEHLVDHTAVEVDMDIQRAAKASDVAHRPQPPARAATALAQRRFDHPQQDVRHGSDRLETVL
jgi:hypothetical protein